MNRAAAWILHRGGSVPADLLTRVVEWANRVPGSRSIPHHLADAGAMALDHAAASGADRAGALDLLAADALITFAMEAQAEEGPEELAEFARTVRGGGRVEFHD